MRIKATEASIASEEIERMAERYQGKNQIMLLHNLMRLADLWSHVLRKCSVSHQIKNGLALLENVSAQWEPSSQKFYVVLGSELLQKILKLMQ